MAREDGGDEDEDETHQRKHEFLNFRRTLDGIRAKQDGEKSQADRMKSQGNQFFQLGCYVQASMMYSEALDLQPENPVLLNNRAMAYLKQGMCEEALADADRSLALDATKENIKAFWRRAQALLDLERYEEAEQAANDGIAVQANNSHLSHVRRRAREAIARRRLCGVDWVGKMENGVEKKYSFSKDGEMTMTVVGHALKATFDLSVECTPQSMVVKMKPMAGSGSAPPPPVPYIYTFQNEDQELWLCHPVSSNELPKSFAGPGFSRLQRVEQELQLQSDESQPLEQRCACYMQEFCEILPLLPPQLPEKPSQEEVSQEIVLMEKVTKLKKRFGHEVHQKAMDLAKGAAVAESRDLAALAEGLRERLVARKVLPADCPMVVGPEANATATPFSKDTGAIADAQSVHTQGLFDCVSGLVQKICGTR
mmetsp:Transcript_40275/g.93309  ORF Transcript_40275/g.93309 Transcript_40275/m.93309 type:complete len:425 (+) Transcript_40275:70-1344(+)